MKLSAIILVIVVGFSMTIGVADVYASASQKKENVRLLEMLDSIIANQKELVAQKEMRIAGLRQTISNVKGNSELLHLYKQLYNEYIVFDSDSALYYASEARKLMSKTNPADYDDITLWKLNEAFIYTVQGLFNDTMELLDGIDSSKLSPEMKSMYFSSLSYIYSMRSVYMLPNEKMAKEDLKKANEYRDSIQALECGKNQSFLWVPIATSIEREGGDLGRLDVSELKKTVDESTGASRENAINSYWLSRYYESQGDMDAMVWYKTKAAINDALIVNREIAALQELATYLFEKGDINRAYNYLLYTVEQANLYHNRFRMVNLSDVLPTVRDAYREELEKRDRRLTIYVYTLLALALILIGSIVFIILEFSRLKKTRNLLKLANNELKISVRERDAAIAKLEKANEDLNKANSDLNEADRQKLGLLAYVFKLTTRYINALEDYRKKLLKKYKVKKIDDLGVLINDPELIKEHYQGFYENFDRTVLSIYPDFIEDYNKTVGEDSKFSAEIISKTKTLNTKLRIYALRRLGISKSSEIAEMLNVSIRTVYNNRSSNLTEE